jgi:hypothetical protein
MLDRRPEPEDPRASNWCAASLGGLRGNLNPCFREAYFTVNRGPMHPEFGPSPALSAILLTSPDSHFLRIIWE